VLAVKTTTWETLKDLLVTNNRSKWIPKFEANEAFKQQALENPAMIQGLPDDSQDIDKWIVDYQRQNRGVIVPGLNIGGGNNMAFNLNRFMKEAKKKAKKSPKEHGFIEQCMKENSDKSDPGAYCASIVDKVKGTTDWRKEK
jgi:hypothetical protein